MKFVCFVGKDKVGKTTMSKALCNMLLRGYRKPTMIMSFADPLRNELIELYGLPEEIIRDKSVDKKSIIFKLGEYSYDSIVPDMWVKSGMLTSVKDFDSVTISFRELMVTHGTHVCRTLDKDHWLRHFSNRVEEVKDTMSFIICDDARNPDDFKYFTDKDTTIIHLDNGVDNGTNTEQDNFLKWISDNEVSINKKLEVSVPLLQFTAEKLVKKEVLPLLVERQKSRRVYHDDIFE